MSNNQDYITNYLALDIIFFTIKCVIQLFSIAGLCPESEIDQDLWGFEPLSCIFITTADITKISRKTAEAILKHKEKSLMKTL